MNDKSYLTAIPRKALPLPTRWLLKKKYVYRVNNEIAALTMPTVLDFGCGKCKGVNPRGWFNYDPHYRPWDLSISKDFFDVVICNYVLCVLPRKQRLEVLNSIRGLLNNEGTAYISVRNDKPRQGWGKSSKGTYQGRVQNLDLPLLYECANFRIYTLTKATILLG